jgi:hypothetical protein
MVWGVEYSRGQRTDEVRQWVGPEARRVSYSDSDRNNVPETVTFTDFAGRLVQRWIDDNRDGRADQVALYENNRVVRVIR